MTPLLQRFIQVRRGEGAAVVASSLSFFFILTALMVIRPAREALGMQRGIEAVRWLFIGTAVVTLAVNPVFALLVSRYRRIVSPRRRRRARGSGCRPIRHSSRRVRIQRR
jgi:ATP:ADP antiporter, AAA family